MRERPWFRCETLGKDPPYGTGPMRHRARVVRPSRIAIRSSGRDGRSQGANRFRYPLSMDRTKAPISDGSETSQRGDVLSSIFEAARVRATTWSVLRSNGPFIDAFDGVQVHQHRVARGACRLRVDDTGEVVDLREGDFVFLTRRQAHTLSVAERGEDSEELVVVSGAFRRGGESADALFALLPP